MASPIECEEVAHAVTAQVFGPLALCKIDIQPAAMLTMNIGTVNGEQQLGPFVIITWNCSSID
jgi:hypothetical protein